MNYEGHIDDLILLATSDDFGIIDIRITIRDDQRNVFESGDAFEDPMGSGIWNYLATTEVPSDTHVIVQAVATDSLDAVGTLSESTTTP